ncbi:MAG: hypothetical protein ACMUIG_03535 [Thermoplasmatota archaeon]
MTGKSPLIRSAAIMIVFLLSFGPLPGAADTENCISSEICGEEPPTRLSRQVTIDRIRWGSGGITQWDYMNYGVINRTTLFEVTLKNNKLENPVYGVELNFTVYWHGGIGSDTQRIMYRDYRLVDINGGVGTLSEPILITWKPQYAGTYLINFSVHSPKDPRPITDIYYEQGISVKRGDGTSYRTGVWVGTGSWDCTKMEGWTSESSGGLPNHTWRPSDHPIGLLDPTQHTAGSTFWVGNGSSNLGPTSGVYGLISPPIDLSVYDPDPSNPSEEGTGPKVYFAYKYNGNITPDGPSGKGAIRHYVREVGTEEWTILSDLYGNPIIINDNNTLHDDPVWNYPKRTIPGSSVEPQPGIDLGRYQGKRIQIKLEYTPSGIPETGYLIDDIILIGLQRVDITPFQITRVHQEAEDLHPGTDGRFGINLTSKEGGKATTLRLTPVNASEPIDINNDIDIHPEIITLPENTEYDAGIDITLRLNESAPSGPAQFTIRIIGGGIFRDITFKFNVMARHSLVSYLSGRIEGPIDQDEQPVVTLEMRNGGNSPEIVNYTFVSEDDLSWDVKRGRIEIDVGRSIDITGRIGISGSRLPGNKSGYIVISTGSLPDDAQLLSRILSDEIGSSWTVHHLQYRLLQKYSLETLSNSTFIPIIEPGTAGTQEVFYRMIVMNYGNGPDLLTFSQVGIEEGLNITIDLPQNLDIRPGEAKLIDIPVRLNYPVPLGRFEFTVTVHSSGVEDEANNSVDFVLSIGREPLESGLYLINNSLVMEPMDSILGADTIIIFDVRSYGLKHQSPFSITLEVDGEFAKSSNFITSSTKDTNCQIKHRFDVAGHHNITIRIPGIEDQITPDLDLVYQLDSSINVYGIDIQIADLRIRIKGEEHSNGDTVDPGSYTLNAEIFNHGDIDAEVVNFIVNVTNMDTEETTTIHASLPFVVFNTSSLLEVPDLKLNASTEYTISLELDENVNWQDTNTTGNFMSITVTVGPEPPKEPFWRNPIFVFIGLGITLVVLGIIFFYTMSRKSKSYS